jgi:deazaflavin-dependent oxidoreductase (nitroreductase family)
MALTPESWPAPLRRAIRVWNKYVTNPVMRRFAGGENSYAGVIDHVGRKSGKQYSTPIGAERIADGFLIPLGYGAQVDWLRNVLAAGRATVTSKGETREVRNPRVIDAREALPILEPAVRRRYERLGIAQYLKVAFA